MLFLSLLVPAVLLVTANQAFAQTDLQNECTDIINEHFECVDEAMVNSPDHEQMKSNVDHCFLDNGCQGTPETFFQAQGAPKPPTPEQSRCIGTVQDKARDACQKQLFGSIIYQFPDTQPKGGPPPGPPPPGGPGSGRGPGGGPDFSQVIKQLCPNSAAIVAECVEKAQDSGPAARATEQFHSQMQGCMQPLLENQKCMQQLQSTQRPLCSCVQTAMRSAQGMAQLQVCANFDKSTIFAQEIAQGHLSPHIFGPICGPGPGGHGPGSLGPGGGPPPFGGPPQAPFGKGPPQFGGPPQAPFGKGPPQFGGPPQAPFGKGPPQAQFGQGFQGQFGQGPQGQFGQGQFGQGSQGQFGQGPQGQFGQVPQGQFGLGPQGQFGLGPQGQFGQVPQGQFGQVPQGQFGQEFQSQFGQGAPQGQFGQLPEGFGQQFGQGQPQVFNPAFDQGQLPQVGQIQPQIGDGKTGQFAGQFQQPRQWGGQARQQVQYLRQNRGPATAVWGQNFQ